MNFDEKDLMSVALVGFDLINGPILKWQQDFHQSNLAINLDEFAANFYLAFKGGNEGIKPKAILYDDFAIVAFPRGLELCCMFLKPSDDTYQLTQLAKVAERVILRKDTEEEQTANINTNSDLGQEVTEVERILVNLLRNTEMSTPELRRAFNLNNSQIWKIVTDLEERKQLKRTGKHGRAICWTAS
ncbi:MAG: hypothetical protein RBG13Loki_2469 [Promethearchaeota archaeon CR_4]|nr:MAG: hypothetical protein RBG13Loki_2469 [Candidatus Lokiarchaeota archaeon CR_4]